MTTNDFSSNIERLHREKLETKIALEQSSSELKNLYGYFKENRKGIIWSAINPIDKNTAMGNVFMMIKNAVIPILQSESGINLKNKTDEASVASAVAMMAIKGIKSWIEKRNEKRKLKNKDEEADTELDIDRVEILPDEE
jgi:hypothetical protein